MLQPVSVFGVKKLRGDHLNADFTASKGEGVEFSGK
jgi:hypothetical protein